MSERYSIAKYVDDLRRITANSNDEGKIIEQVGPCAQQLAADHDWIEERFFHPDKSAGFSAFLLHEEDDHRLAVLAVSWSPGMGVMPHDHGTWAVVVGVEGTERNIRYKRLGDRSVPKYFELAVKKEASAGPGDLICMRTGGIHAVYNDSDKVTLSLHTYGVHINYSRRHQFDLNTHAASEFKVHMN